MATLKALPSEIQLGGSFAQDAAGGKGDGGPPAGPGGVGGRQVDAGSYLLALKLGEKPQRYRDFMKANKGSWGEEPSGGFPDLARRVEHLLHLMLRTIEKGAGGQEEEQGGVTVHGDLEIQPKEMQRWMRVYRWESE